MIAEIFLGLVALGLLVAFVAYIYLTNKEKAKLVNAIIAKDAGEMFSLDMGDKTKVEKPDLNPIPDEFGTPIEDIPDDEFMKILNLEETGNGKAN